MFKNLFKKPLSVISVDSPPGQELSADINENWPEKSQVVEIARLMFWQFVEVIGERDEEEITELLKKKVPQENQSKPEFFQIVHQTLVMRAMFEAKDLFHLTEKEIEDAVPTLYDPTLVGTEEGPALLHLASISYKRGVRLKGRMSTAAKIIGNGPKV